MFNTWMQGIVGILFLLLAFCNSFFIGKEIEISTVSLIVLILVFSISHFICKKRNRLHWVYLGGIAAETLFLFTNTFFILALGTGLLLVAGAWNIFSLRINAKGAKRVLTVCKILFGIFTALTGIIIGVNLYVNPITTSIQLSEDRKVIIDDAILATEADMLKEIEIMNSFGSRTTGSEGHNRFIQWLKQQVSDMGYEVYQDNYTFDRWEAEKSALYINNQEISVASPFPYSGETDKDGVTGELVYIKAGNYNQAKGKIAVVEINNTRSIPLGFVMNTRRSFPTKSHVIKGDGDLVLTTVLQDPDLAKAKKAGVQAVILVWKGASDDKVSNQYLPFTTEYAGIPAVWVNETEGEKVIASAKSHQKGTVILEAQVQKAVPTDSFYVVLEGKKKEETIIINSHTDGVNVVEENGTIGMLSMLRYLQQERPERTMVFAFITGHFRLPEFKGTSQATSTWMQAHPELWDGKDGHRKAVAGITVEHLGSMEWKDNEYGEYLPTGDIQSEYTYAGNKTMEAIWLKAIQDRRTTRTVFLRGHNKFEFGESQPLFEAGIPVIGLIPMPDYLMTDSQNREMDKFDITLMHEQIESLLKAAIIIDNTSTAQLGKADKYSFFYGKTK
ncbi:hypothetical protein acsn021_14570 [Anaerocolumna cellulosilytica]|uniref:Uncharacterized protein n=1 Tax=Anaerocolumna cellulosilytica TaxID=433286 RepID=A0A6S6R499_9FIRM|nr:hypothetical protein [Anaerocolumna cellulosilytica]MBB5195644.1 hypothetical protein [Anaerocolumna cellulosilytica]BCJ93888.1 hypothetical protein acsn021_14570 [Anaerocolumna cellulosilytica]